MKRGEIVVIATRGPYTGKPRPALVVQGDLFNSTHASLTVCPITSALVDAPIFRIALPAGTRTGLETASQVMVDKIVTVPREAVSRTIGRLTSTELDAVDDALRMWIDV